MKLLIQIMINICCCIFLGCYSDITIVNNRSVIFFASNTITNISIASAYTRLMGIEQYNLKNNITQIMQNNNIEQGTFENILGKWKGYANNTEGFITSSNQIISEQKVDSIAKELAIALSQISIAVFIPNNSQIISEVSVTFSSSTKLTYNQVLQIMSSKLSAKYNQAFSMYLDHSYYGINAGKIYKIEWLGSDLDINAIKNAFPNSSVSFQTGKAFLVYQNGNIHAL